MEYKRQLNRRWFQKALIFLIFGMFTAKAQGQLLPPPTITVQPASTNVQNEGTATFNITAKCSLSVISGVTWYYNGNPVSLTNASVGVNVSGLLSTTINSTLVINQVSTNCLGNYTAVVVNLLGGAVTTSKAALGLLPTISAVPAATGLVSNGFKLQFSGPTGSNLVIEATSDFKTWTPVYTNLIVDGSVSYTDTAVKTYPGRFYRAMLK